MSQDIDSTAHQLKYLSKVMPPPYEVYDQIELVNKVHEFYSDSFALLVSVTAILVGIVGIVVPLIVARKSDFDKQSLFELKSQLTRITEKYSTTEKEYLKLKDQLANEIRDLELMMNEKSHKLDNTINSRVYHIQAVISNDKKIFSESLNWMIYSIKSALLAQSSYDDVIFKIKKLDEWMKNWPDNTKAKSTYSSSAKLLDDLFRSLSYTVHTPSLEIELGQVLNDHSSKIQYTSKGN